MLKARYRNSKNEILEIPLVEVGPGKFVLETEDGRQRPYDDKLSDDPAHGLVTFLDIVEEKAPLPQPGSPERTEALTQLQATLGKFSAAELQVFLAKADSAELRKAIDARNDFVNFSAARIKFWSNGLTEEAQRLEEAKRKAIPEREFTQEERRRVFTGKVFGDMFIGNVEIPSCAENGFDGTYYVECHRCRKLKDATMKVSDILRVQEGYLPVWKCAHPCGRG